MPESFSRLVAVVVGEVRDTEREPEARGARECLKRFLQAYNGGSRSLGIREQHPIAETIRFVLRISLDGQAHGRDGVLYVTCQLVDVCEGRKDWPSLDSTRHRAFQRAPGSRYILLLKSSACEKQYHLNVVRVSGGSRFEFFNRFRNKGSREQGCSKFRPQRRLKAVAFRRCSAEAFLIGAKILRG